MRAIYIGAAAEGKDMLNQGPVWALGAMSGTSLDGVDAALVQTDGERICDFGETAYRPYQDRERACLSQALGRRADDRGVAQAAMIVENVHADLLSGLGQADIVGFHGQTLGHWPDQGQTHQAGNGALLAEVLGIPVVWDFRTMDMDLGGQGAPLAPFFHFACAKWIGATAPLIFLNVGGVANMTYVDPAFDRPEQPGALLAFDTGPGNAPLNDLMQQRFGRDMDRDGALAARGQADADILNDLGTNGYFHKIPPKSLDRDDFAFLSGAVSGLSDADAAATLTAAIATSVMHGMQHCPQAPTQVLVTGGGRRNPVVMRTLAAGLDARVAPVESVGLDGDMLEAQAFAYLAVRVARGLPTSCATTTGVSAAVGGGKISRPTAKAG